MDFRVILEKGDDGFWTATCPSLPGCISQGKTERDAAKNMRHAIKLHLHCLAEDGLPLVQNKKDHREFLLEVAL